jgi:hypothetical protein
MVSLQNFFKRLSSWEQVIKLIVAGVKRFLFYHTEFSKNKFSNGRKTNVQKIANATP